MELSVTRERLASLEALLADSGALESGALDNFEPDIAASQMREANRQKLIQDILGPLINRLSSES